MLEFASKIQKFIFFILQLRSVAKKFFGIIIISVLYISITNEIRNKTHLEIKLISLYVATAKIWEPFLNGKRLFLTKMRRNKKRTAAARRARYNVENSSSDENAEIHEPNKKSCGRNTCH